MSYTPENNGHAHFQEAFFDSNEEAQTKEELERRLQEISQMKTETQDEIRRLRVELEGTTRTAESLEADEEAIRQHLSRLKK
ncbi:MAG: hypothetical protein ACJ74J_17785 [Blastocatellia bacterium]